MADLKTYSVTNDITSSSVDLDVLHQEIKDSNTINDFDGLTNSGDSIIIKGDSFSNEAACDNVISSHIAPIPNPTIEYIKSSYITKEIDGEKYFDDWRAKLVVDYQLSILTEADLYDIEDEYDKVFKRLLRGDWMSANNKLNDVTIGGAITQARHDIIVSEIQSYVLNNY